MRISLLRSAEQVIEILRGPEPLGNAGQAPAFGPKFEELVFSVGIIHMRF